MCIRDSRKDYQIKHMGHRIELGEIELIVNQLDEVGQACCVFDDSRKKIILFYTGAAEAGEVAAYIKEKPVSYTHLSSRILSRLAWSRRAGM